MTLYVDSAGVQIYATDGDAPEGGIAVEPVAEYVDQVWQFPGWSESLIKAGQIENSWRTSEMVLARENVTAIQFGDETIVGAEQDWMAYWLALRKWTDANSDFPNISKRPVRPT